ncbi:MAG: UvrD-helicase domain-containing protein, partial [Candidatus Hydrogenedentes bacterium]|nr:UvrD-helicase domain-containing protein [Candidatus Hydrogenedentota bacterium]
MDSTVSREKVIATKSSLTNDFGLLNEAQRMAVAAPDGPALVLAGAGSGKTRVIVERIVWLVEERGVDPRHILAVTFTNRAAGEMKDRVASRIGAGRASSWVGTFHAFGLYLLRREIERLGRPRVFTVFDDADQLSLMKRLLKNLPGQYARVTPREALQWISRLKQDVDEPDMTEPCATDEDETCRALWVRYHEALLRASSVDFDDLLVLPVRLLEGDSDACARYRRRFRYVLVDEYQDTNRAQFRLAKCLAGDGGNLFAVGDEDQSIYSWRGADIRNILEFDKDFPGASVYRLEQNYRSTMPILDTANAVVVNNRDRLGKTLWTRQESGEP